MNDAARTVWRDGFAPLLSTNALIALKDALEADDPALVQGAITQPPPLQQFQECACQAGCAYGLSCWRGDGLVTVGEVVERFAQACHEVDLYFGEPRACRHFINWFDDTPRDQMRRELLPEVLLALVAKGFQVPGAA